MYAALMLVPKLKKTWKVIVYGCRLLLIYYGVGRVVVAVGNTDDSENVKIRPHDILSRIVVRNNGDVKTTKQW